jgi:hypothetical protein
MDVANDGKVRAIGPGGERCDPLVSRAGRGLPAARLYPLGKDKPFAGARGVGQTPSGAAGRPVGSTRQREAPRAVDPRTTTRQGIVSTPSVVLPPMASNIRWAARRPSISKFMSTLVSCGRAPEVRTSQLSKPITATWFGTFTPRSSCRTGPGLQRGPDRQLPGRTARRRPGRGPRRSARRRRRVRCAGARWQPGAARPACRR